MEFSYSHKLSSQSDVRSIQSMEDNGFSGCELFFPDREALDEQTMNMVSEVSGTTSLALTAHMPFKNINVASVYPYVRDSSNGLILNIIDNISDYVDMVTLHTGYASPNVPGGMEKAVELNIASLIKICDHAKQYDIMVGVENAMNDRNMVGKTFGEMEQLLRGVGRNNLGITFDVGHANLTRNIDDYIAKKDYIVEVHAHDNFGYSDEHLAIGEGKINWGSVYDRIKDMNCALVLEQKTMVDALKSFKYLDGLSIDGSAYQRLNMLLLEIKAEKSARDLLPINNDMTRLCESVLAFGATGSNINHIVSSCRDAMTFRVAEMVLDEMSPSLGRPRHKFTLMAIGSFGREEMSVESDQDTILVLDDTVDDAGRLYFKMFAESLVSHLSYAGFPRCKGNMMASNKKWRGTTPELLSHLSNTYERSVIMDARFICGDRPLAHRFLKMLHYQLNTDPSYATDLARSAVSTEVGLEGESLKLEYFGGAEDSFNIKKYGFRIFSQSIKALSVKYHITRTNIAERLWKLHDLGVIDREAINRYMFAYDQLTRVMMLGFVQNIKRGIVSNDYIQPYLLSKRDLKGLKEALRIAKEVQGLCARQFDISK